jgi:hypothetical protein
MLTLRLTLTLLGNLMGAGGPPPSVNNGILLEDNTSFLLLEDNVSILLLEAA